MTKQVTFGMNQNAKLQEKLTKCLQIFLDRYRTHICTRGSVETDASVADLSVSLCVVVVAPLVCADTTE